MNYNETRRTETIRCNRSSLNMAMKLARWSNADLARMAGVAKGTVGNLRSGARTTCNVETAVKIEKALRVDAGDIFVRHVLIVDPAA